ncbi:MAG TPA: D-alanyl-D-alanine carboxypeptidase/D-alanyl-D-alanine-endopeptidase [Acidimicrobiales bacterium]
MTDPPPNTISRSFRLALVAVVLGIAIVGAAFTPAAADDEPAPPVPATPVLSARRLPGVLQGTVADPAMAEKLDSYLDRAAGDACAVVLDRGRLAYSRDAQESQVPASILKLLTGTAALEVLGADSHLTTVVGAVAPMADGVVDGDLFLVGGGDPLLTTPGYQESLDDTGQVVEQYAELADALVAAGLREVTGDIVGDDSRYDTERWIPSWPDRYQREGFIGPLSALMVNDGQTGFTTSPDQPNPSRKPGDPPALAAQTLKTLLSDRGVAVRGAGVTGEAPDELSEVARKDSLPIADLVGEMLTSSDNTTAELLTREMGLAARGEGTTEAGLGAIVETLGSLGYDTTGLELNDGSGLDPENTVPCPLALEVLTRAGRDSVIGRSLAVAGETGTLRKRMLDSPATGRVHAKTGTLNAVNALAGWADTPTGNAITFLMIQNGSQPGGLAWVDRYAELLMDYAEAPGLDVLGPLPVVP